MYSKSFIAILGKIIYCILHPGGKASVVSEFKKQAAEIGKAKIDELTYLMPLIKEEFNTKHGSGQSTSSDYVKRIFKNRAELDVVSIEDSTRGGRRHGIEENAMKVFLPAYYRGMMGRLSC